DNADPGCSSPQDNDESDGTSQCQDGLDNDADNVIDATDPGCWADVNDPSSYDPTDLDESDATTQCQDGVDNDGDGYTDGDDVSCEDPTDNNEGDPQPVCQNGLDDDADGLIDAADPGCLSNPNNPSTYNPNGSSEVDATDVTCGDTLDNDNDGLTDAQDPDCWSDPRNPDSYDPTNPNGENTPQFSPCVEETIALRDLTGLVAIKVFERSGAITEYSFGKDSAEVGSDLEQNEDVNDFATEEKEYYDVFVSNSNGELDVKGSYFTIEALANGTDGLSHNIDAVHLVLSNGTEIPADIVSKIALGENIGNDVLVDSGFAKLALGEKDEATSVLGDGNTRLTVGFCEALAGACQVGDPCTCEVENISESILEARGDNQYQFILDSTQKFFDKGLDSFLKKYRYDVRRRKRRGFIRVVRLHETLVQIPGIVLSNCPTDVACTSVSTSDLKARAEKLINQLWRIGRNNLRLERRQRLVNKGDRKRDLDYITELREQGLAGVAQIPDSYLSCQ
ncbi:MAG: hypothetical protein KDD62_11745, partial [Bdellovibrionales bacterium]|nr:hypothetical protein [Bdellovibrionales bacterium]